MKKNDRLSLLALAILSFAYILPVFRAVNDAGIHDWPQFYAWNGYARDSMLLYGQFPLWNPYIGGGNPALAHPMSSFLSPFFLPVLAFGEIAGGKTAMLLFLLAGTWGMYFLAKYSGFSAAGRLYASVLWSFNGCTAYHFSVGHMDHFPGMLLPLVFLFYLKAVRENRKNILYCALFLALVILSGGAYPLVFCSAFLLFYSLARSIQEKNARPFLFACAALAACFLLSAVKLLPMGKFLLEKEFIPPVLYPAGWKIIFNSFFARGLSLKAPYAGALGTWEFGNYTGLIPAGVFAVALPIYFRKEKALVVASLFFLLIAFSMNIAPLKGVVSLFFTEAFHIPFRFVVVFLFCMSLLSGRLVSSIETGDSAGLFPVKKNAVLAFLLALIVAVDLVAANMPVFRDIFTAGRETPLRNETFRQGRIDWLREKDRSDYLLAEPYALEMYEKFKSNSGVINPYDPVRLPCGAASAGEPGYRGEAFLLKHRSGAVLKYFSPGRLIVEINAPGRDVLVINQNYERGWKVSMGGVRGKTASYRGLLSAGVPGGVSKIIFYYRPGGFIAGLLISACALLTALKILLSKNFL